MAVISSLQIHSIWSVKCNKRFYFLEIAHSFELQAQVFSFLCDSTASGQATWSTNRPRISLFSELLEERMSTLGLFVTASVFQIHHIVCSRHGCHRTLATGHDRCR